MNHSHYFKSVKHLETIDVYRVLDLFAVTDSALAHAAKKILCAGNRGAKDQAKDVQGAIDSLQRWQEMQRENIVGMTAQQAIAFEDKELPSSGIYGDEGYTEADKQAASLDPALVELCSKTTIHADADGWIEHVAEGCPIKNDLAMVEIETFNGGVASGTASEFEWGYGWRKSNCPKLIIKRWRYVK